MIAKHEKIKYGFFYDTSAENYPKAVFIIYEQTWENNSTIQQSTNDSLKEKMRKI